jgi:hypothetical protein
MLRTAACPVLFLLLAAPGNPARVTPGSPRIRVADSLSLERTVCYGTCPAYRILVTQAGRLTFVGTHPDDSTRATTQLPRSTTDSIFQVVADAPLSEFPPKIQADSTLCPDLATDHPTVILTIFAGADVRRIEDYHGCYLRSDHSIAWRLATLRALEESIDRLAGTSRWKRFLRNRY